MWRFFRKNAQSIPIMKHLLTGLFALLGTAAMAQQLPTVRYANRLTPVQQYVCQRTPSPLHIDGRLDEAAWQQAADITHFVDISGGNHPAPRYHTTAKMLWDDDYLYVAAVMEEPHVWATLTKRDTIVYHDNDFEVFIDPDGDGHNYFEVEVNALNTVFDLSLTHPYRAPQRPFVQFQWNCPGLLVATSVQGTLNDASDTDRGWTLEMAIPRQALASEFERVLEAGKQLRIGFSRVEWQHTTDAAGRYVKKKDRNGRPLREDNWTWGATGLVAMHMPERWGCVQLSSTTVGTTPEAFVPMADVAERRLLWAGFYAQEDFFKRHRRYATTLKELGFSEADFKTLPKGVRLHLETTSRTYQLFATYANGKRLTVNEMGRIF